MRFKRCFVMAMLLSMGLLVVADAGVAPWTTAALADHNDDPDDDERAVEQQGKGKQRCRERPNPRKCRRRRDKQERNQRDDDRRGNKERDEAPDGPPPGAAPTPPPEEPCILPDLEDLEDVSTVGPFVCDLYRDLTPIVP